MKKLPWLEIVLVLVLVLMSASAVKALFGERIVTSIEDFCTINDLFCAPPTPTPTFTPTPTNTPRPTRTPTPTLPITPTFTMAIASTPTEP